MTTNIGALLASVKIVNPDGTPSTYFFRFINTQILDRLGGLVSSSNAELEDEIAQLQGQSFATPSDPQAALANMGVDELRNEVASLRSSMDALMQSLWMRDAELLMLRTQSDLRPRVEQLEDLMLKAS